MEQRKITTERLILRPFTLTDAPDVQRLAGEPEIADTVLNIPHPYKDGMAEEWIATHEPNFRDGKLANFAITTKDTGDLIGAIGLVINKQFNHAEMGYWIGRPFWNGGFCTEAARAIIAYAFDDLQLHKVHAHYMIRNPASGRVMEKIGMVREGLLREHVLKDGVYEDIVCYGIVRNE
ncbi:MAG: GNAT family N-acetyltransferase [Candidatus Zixiibacteriota bacterium]